VVKAVSFFIPMPRIMPRIFSYPTEVKSFDKYVEGWDNFVSVTTNRLDELRYNYLLII
jgi:flagellar motor switch protein FliM